MEFELPEDLSAEGVDIDALRAAGQAEIARLQAEFAENEDLSDEDVTYLTYCLDGIAAIDAFLAEQAESAEADAAHNEALSTAMARAAALSAAAEVETEEVETEEVEEPSRELAAVGAPAAPAPKPTRRPVFKGKGVQEDVEVIPETPSGPGWVVSHGSPGFDDREYGTRVGFAAIGKALDSVTKGRGVGRLSGTQSGPKFRQSIAKMDRGLKVIDNQRDLVDEINRATSSINGQKVTTDALVAAGGWCAPSEQIYTFCDIPEAGDLISLPEIAIQRGGIRWPVEPDLSALFESFEFFFTEPELEAVDGNGQPTAIKHCVEIPCPDEFEELRLNAVGYCVEAGILQRQGWPESIEYVLRALTQEHMRSMSRRTILDMWNGSGAPKLFDANLQVGGTSGVLNALDLYATNLRLNKGYNKAYPMEIVAPSWFHAALRADMAMMEGIDTKYVTDAQITQWLSARNISGQFVGDWQTRDVNLPGHLDTLRWPGHVDILMYPAGTWFRHLSNIIEVGVLYPKEQLQINRYTEFFTEDAIAVGKRCDRSVNLRIPLKLNGGYGAPVTISYTDTTPDSGAGHVVGAEPVPGGQADQSVTKTYTLATATGTVTAGTFKITVQGEETAAIAYNATAAQVKAAIVALDEAYADYVVAGGGALPGTAVTLKVPEGWGFALSSPSLTGGTFSLT